MFIPVEKNTVQFAASNHDLWHFRCKKVSAMDCCLKFASLQQTFTIKQSGSTWYLWRDMSQQSLAWRSEMKKHWSVCFLIRMTCSNLTKPVNLIIVNEKHQQCCGNLIHVSFKIVFDQTKSLHVFCSSWLKDTTRKMNSQRTHPSSIRYCPTFHYYWHNFNWFVRIKNRPFLYPVSLNLVVQSGFPCKYIYLSWTITSL